MSAGLIVPFLSEGWLIAVAFIASWSDARKRRISNWLCLATLFGGLFFAFLSSGMPALGSHVLHALIALAVGMVIWKIGGFGGGDAKFYASVAAWFELTRGLLLLLAVSLSGIVLLFVWFAWRRATGQPIRWSNRTAGDGLPYGIAIAAGALVAHYIMI
jgi:prepilin peptidase CpaA